MSSTKTLLYPFSIDDPYFEGYAWAVELAFRMKAKLQPFTASSLTSTASGTQSIYHSLLEAQGYYMQHYPHAGVKASQVVHEPCVVAGALDTALVAHVREHPVDIVIIDSSLSAALDERLPEIVKESAAVIVLPGRQGNMPPSVDTFYDDLRRARLYKLPSHFFSTLGKDHSAFNYLRKFFQKNQF